MTGALVAVLTAVTALVGSFVALLAYQGYRRNDSHRMRALAVGVAAIAVAPHLVGSVLAPATPMSDAQVVFLVTLSHALGLAAIYRSFD